MAAMYGHSAVATLLLESGAAINEQGKVRSDLHLSSQDYDHKGFELKSLDFPPSFVHSLCLSRAISVSLK